MLLNIIKRSFINQKKAMAVMVVSVAVGTSIAASLLSLSFDISSKVLKELRSFGANITVQPKVTGLADIAGQKRYLREEDIVKAKTIFWRHNIVGVTPMLLVEDKELSATLLGTWYKKGLAIPGEKKEFETGVAVVMPWWNIEGRWPATDREILAGMGIAERLKLRTNDTIRVKGKEFTIAGIASTGGKEDDMLIGDLATVQKLSGLEGKISKAFVSAMTTPMDEFAYKDPATMTKKEYEKWYCTGYVTSISKQIEEVFAGSTARPVWTVAETEGKVLNRLNMLIYLLTAASLISAALGVSTTMIMSLLRRSDEVALMKAIGADSLKITVIFLTEALIIGISGGMIGYLVSLGISGYIGITVFGAALQQKAFLFPASIGVSVAISLLGVYLPIRRALSIRPAVVLKGG
ncbi:MAG: ABC transporter permease [bacterium]